jgi:DNA helicase-2/ATP-dependent DNA helicase PcrA
MTTLLDGLNTAQREAVVHGQGPLLIIAGAGTGKTKVITQRIAYLIEQKYAKPEEILAVTFTEKAANEMEERVDLLIPYSYSFVEIHTFNSFGESVLRNYAIEIGYPPDFRLLDDVEQTIFFREHLFKIPLKYYRPLSAPTRYIRELLTAVKKLKQEGIKPEKYLNYSQKSLKEAKNEVEKEEAEKHFEIANVYRAHQELLQKEGKIDFEDQVTLVVDLFKMRPSILHLYQEKYKYILVDEFQDTNYIQFEMLKLMAGNHKNLTVVGDDDQSIFRFRGASLSNILNFSKTYNKVKKIVLTENYRSTQHILDTSYKLIQHNNPDRLEVQEKINKKLISVSDAKEKSLHMLQFDRLSHEADRVAEIIGEKIRTEGFQYSDIAILVRRNADADTFLRALNMKGIPFRFSGSRGLYARDEIKILMSFIKALTDFEDSRSLFYLAISEIYNLDPYDLTVLSNYAQKKNDPLHRVFKRVSDGKDDLDLSKESREIAKKIFQDLMYFVQIAGTKNAGHVLYTFLERSGWLKSLVEKEDIEAEIKIKNIRIFFDKVKNFSGLTGDDSIHSFAQYLDLLQQVGDNPATAEAELEEDAVHVITFHKAKGLEFPVVFMVGLVADRFPGRGRKGRIQIPDKILPEGFPEGGQYIHEERRLFYVGMTRAKKTLYLTWAQDYGLKRLKKVSPFVKEALVLTSIPGDVIRTTALEEIRRFAPKIRAPFPVYRPKRQGMLILSFYQVDDYLTCPLKYNLRHIVRIKPPVHHNLVFGRILHSTIHFYLKSLIMGKKISEKDLLKEYKNRWVNEGFLSREHEEMRKAAGEKALCMFYARHKREGVIPQFLEKNFKWHMGKLGFSGRWDRVDYEDGEAVIIDFKATEVKDQKTADKKAKDSLQMDVYVLSFQKTGDRPVREARLFFLESDIIGRAQKGEKEMENALNKIRTAESGIRSENYEAKPDWHHCSYCEFRTICPYSFAY